MPDRRVVVCSEHTHSSIDKAARVLELELRRVPVDDAYRMRADLARRERRVRGRRDRRHDLDDVGRSRSPRSPRGRATRGCTSTPRTRARRGCVPSSAPRTSSGADSLVVNPHKWLLTGMGCSCLWTSRPEDFRRAFSLVPEYLRTPDEVISLSEVSIPLGRPFRALRLWAVLRCYGRAGLQAQIREHVRLAALFEEWVRDEPGWEVCAPRPFSVVCFRRDGVRRGERGAARARQRDRRDLHLAHAARRPLRPAARDRQRADDGGRRAHAWEVLRAVRAVIFDLWDTLALWPAEAFEEVKRALVASHRRLRSRLGTTYNARQIGPIEAYFRGLGLDDDAVAECLRHPLGLHARRARAARRARSRRSTSCSGAASSAALISVCSSDVEELWDETELAPHVDDVVLSCAVGLSKPDPRIYELACERLERARPTSACSSATARTTSSPARSASACAPCASCRRAATSRSGPKRAAGSRRSGRWRRCSRSSGRPVREALEDPLGVVLAALPVARVGAGARVHRHARFDRVVRVVLRDQLVDPAEAPARGDLAPRERERVVVGLLLGERRPRFTRARAGAAPPRPRSPAAGACTRDPRAGRRGSGRARPGRGGSAAVAAALRSQRPQQLDEAGGAGDDDVGARRAARAGPPPRRRRPSRRPRARPRARKASRSVVSSPAKSARVQPGLREERARPRCPCPRRAAAAPRAPSARTARAGPSRARALGDALELGARRVAVRVRAVVVREREALVLDGPVDGVAERVQAPAPLVGAVGELEAVAARRRSTPSTPTSSRRDGPGRPRDRADERVALDEAAEHVARLLRHGRVLGPRRRSARACRRRRAGSPRAPALHAVGRARPRPYDTSGAPARPSSASSPDSSARSSASAAG